jgi:hypothetical protein
MYRELRRIRHALKHSCRLVFLHYLPKALEIPTYAIRVLNRLIGGKETKSLSHQILSPLFHSSQSTPAKHTYHTVHIRFSVNTQQKVVTVFTVTHKNAFLVKPDDHMR